MTPEENQKRTEDQREEGREREKKPYSRPELSCLGRVEELTEAPKFS